MRLWIHSTGLRTRRQDYDSFVNVCSFPPPARIPYLDLSDQSNAFFSSAHFPLPRSFVYLSVSVPRRPILQSILSITAAALSSPPIPSLTSYMRLVLVLNSHKPSSYFSPDRWGSFSGTCIPCTNRCKPLHLQSRALHQQWQASGPSGAQLLSLSRPEGSRPEGSSPDDRIVALTRSRIVALDNVTALPMN